MSCERNFILRCFIKEKECKFPSISSYAWVFRAVRSLPHPFIFLGFSSTSLVSLTSSLTSKQFEMLSSLSSHEEENPDHHQNPGSPANHKHQLLVSCAELIAQSDFSSARHVLALLSNEGYSPYGDSTDRLVYQFTRALSIRLNHQSLHNFILSTASSSTALSVDRGKIESSYLSLNQVTPFIRFSHLTANQAILEAIEGQSLIHILDFNTAQGVQWPPLLQAISERANSSNPLSIRITGTGHDLEALQRTGDRLKKFAASLGLNFQFHPLEVPAETSPTSVLRLLSSIAILPDEALAVNCVFYLHRLLHDDSQGVQLFLRAIKSMNAKVVTLAEREASHNNPILLQRFMEALDYYTAVFDSLEATLPPSSPERLSIEQIWFGKEIVDIVSAEEEERKERHERFDRWMDMMRNSGFSNLTLSPFAMAQAKLFLRLHHPSEGYQLQLQQDSFFLGWKNRPLFSVSSWY